MKKINIRNHSVGQGIGVGLGLIIAAALITYVIAYIVGQRDKGEFISRVKTNDRVGLINVDTATDQEFDDIKTSLTMQVDHAVNSLESRRDQFSVDSQANLDAIRAWRGRMSVTRKDFNDGWACRLTHNRQSIPYDETSGASLRNSIESFGKGELKSPFELAVARLSSYPILRTYNNV